MVSISLDLEKQKHFEGFFMFKNVVSQGVSSPGFFSPELFSSVLNLFQHTYISTCSDMKYRKKYILLIRIVLYLKYFGFSKYKIKMRLQKYHRHHNLKGVFQYSVLPSSARDGHKTDLSSKTDVNWQPLLGGRPVECNLSFGLKKKIKFRLYF